VFYDKQAGPIGLFIVLRDPDRADRMVVGFTITYALSTYHH